MTKVKPPGGTAGKRRVATLKVLIEGDADDRAALAATLRDVADDIERLGICNECCGGDEHGCHFDFDVTLGTGVDRANDILCADPEWGERKMAWELKRKDPTP